MSAGTLLRIEAFAILIVLFSVFIYVLLWMPFPKEDSEPPKMRARPYVKPIYTDERATKNPFAPYDWEVECPDLKN